MQSKEKSGRNRNLDATEIRGKTLLNIDLFSRDYWTKQPEA
jgi:hypothetical protein